MALLPSAEWTPWEGREIQIPGSITSSDGDLAEDIWARISAAWRSGIRKQGFIGLGCEFQQHRTSGPHSPQASVRSTGDLTEVQKAMDVYYRARQGKHRISARRCRRSIKMEETVRER
uniref:Transposase n=1 Tax=Ascaris lumbricoides TaxID=6252 RepID=A0A0M3HX79_ASCLU